jgi:hypothetical protein
MPCTSDLLFVRFSRVMRPYFQQLAQNQQPGAVRPNYYYKVINKTANINQSFASALNAR